MLRRLLGNNTALESLPALRVPTVNSYRNPRLELRDKVLSEWLQGLPVLNPALCVPKLMDVLPVLNAEPLKPRDRLRLLELYRTRVNSTFEASDESHLHRLPISREQRNLVKQQVSALCMEMATGYKLVVNDELKARRLPKHSDSLRIGLHRALEQTGHALLHAWRTYSDLPPFAMLECHQIYQIAEQLGAVDLADEEKAPKFLHRYLHLMVLAAVDPFHLKAGECMLLHERLADLVDQCKIVIAPPEQGLHRGQFRIDLASDTAPRPHHVDLSHCEQNDLRVLNTLPMLRQVTQRLRELERNTGSQTEERELQQLRQLLNLLDSERQRAAPRRTADRHAHVAFGLDSVCRILSDPDAHRNAERNGNNYGIQVSAGDDHSLVSLERWHVINESVRGYLLSRPSLDHDGIDVQDISAVLSTDGNLALGVVRWMRNGRSQQLELGIEMLPGIPHLVLWQGGGSDEVSRGVLMPAVSALDMPPSLLVPAGAVHQDETIKVRNGEHIKTFRAGEPLETGSSYQRIRLLPAN